ncbi:MAG: type II toxin-antitoxin system HipA family toxin [Deltaproteobacteria bacterium]|nr:type II toxin-antitoxin system HipA family toxin [Deltaproteobacteria bacterium]
MLKCDIWITFPDGDKAPCGTILCQDPDSRGWIEGAFRYASGYLNDPRAFSLDPEVLPLSSREYPAKRSSGVHAVFEDCLPDDWGRRLLVRKADLERTRQSVPHLLLALGGSGLGALSFGSVEDNKIHSAELVELPDILEAALCFEQGKTVSDEGLRALFRAGSSPGGARPKVLVRDSDGILWIAKFPSTRDTQPMVPIEAATMELAKSAGLDVPETSMIACGKRQVLLVRRFDVTTSGGRLHMISTQTLLRAEGWYNLGYTDLFSLMRKHSSRPEVDIPMLFRQMVFNALIGNTDDHLKNFAMLHGSNGFFLSPAYDLLPDTAQRREHVLHFDYGHLFPGLEHLVHIGKTAGVKKAGEIASQIRDVIRMWRDIYALFGVSTQEIEQLSTGIEKRLEP